MPRQSDSELELRDYLRILRRRRWVVFLAVVIVVGSAVAASFLQTPVYEGRAEVLLQARATESLFDPQTGQRSDPTRAVQTEVQVLRSRPVRDSVNEQLGAVPRVSASPVGQTDLIRIRAENTDPEQAAAVANAYANAYIGFRRKQAVDDLLAAGQEIQRKIAELQRQIDSLDVKEPRRDTLVQQQALFRQKLDQLQVDAALKSGGAQLVTPATAAVSPIRPQPVRTAAIAGAVGLLFGIAVAFLVEYLDDSIKSKEELERAATGLSTLALIPAVSSWKDRRRTMVVSVTEPQSPAAEAYRTLRTSIQFTALDRPLRTIQVTSPAASEGKSTTLANLAVALAQAGQRVVIVDCDLRRPRIHEFFGLPATKGFTSVLLGQETLGNAVQRVRGQDRLVLLPSGPIPPNPAELLAGRRTVEVLTALQAESDVVLIDCPPVLPVTDAAVLSSRVDGTLLVTTAGLTTKRALQQAHEVLRRVEAPIIGTVLNGVTGDAYGYSYRYQYAYAGAQADGRRRREAATRI